MADDSAAYQLASYAKLLSPILLDICRNEKRRLSKNVHCMVGEIATRLRVAYTLIEPLPWYSIEPEVNDICLEMLKTLAVICMWPGKVRILQGLCFDQCINALAGLDQSTMKKSILEYFSHPGNKGNIDSFVEDCRRLVESLIPTRAEESQGLPLNVWNVANYDHSNHNEALFDILQKHCKCRTHMTPRTDTVWHPTRLYLEGNSKSASLGILVSNLDMSFWQEFRLNISSSDSDAATDSYWLDHGHICSLLDREEFARILLEFKPVDRLSQLPSSEAPQFRLAAGRGQSLASILQHYHLTPRDRVSLSYSVARTYWQFYDSELMRRKWSSESIWFMPTSSDDHKDELPLQAFVSFPFESPDHRIEDFIDDLKVPLNHRCPRVFALGVLLLEIGCGSPFTTPVHQNLSSQANFDHSTANNLLQKLRNSKWDGFSHMNYFVGAVEYCLDGKNFIQDSPDSTRRRSQPLKKQQDISERRKNLYNRVVRPLGWLAVKGFKTRSSGTAYIRKIRNAAVTTAQGLPARPKAFVRPKMGKFHNGSTASNNWIQSLVRISAYIDDRRVQLDLTSPIRVAILDTGINYNMPYYEDEEYADNRINQVESFCDFLEPGSSPRDDFGHGSLMARLVAELTRFESTPFARIMVARVARNTRDLAMCQDKIAQAIRWAGSEGADIISMSFGFPRDHQGISDAIHEVAARDGGVIFLASAGNSSDEAEAFPARDPKVISIYATNRHGTFLEFNSQPTHDRTRILGTYGDGIPPEITAEFDREYRGVCQPGSSVATAVAAGTAALMLAYIATFPKVFASSANRKTLQRAHDSRGMEALFRKMGQQSPTGGLFINPGHFWRVNNTDEARFHAISSCLWDVDRYM